MRSASQADTARRRSLRRGPPLKPLDRVLQLWRLWVVDPYIPAESRLLDVGCGDGSLFDHVGKRLRSGVGVDPTLRGSADLGRFQLIAGRFPEAVPQSEPFDVITMLAVVEHLPDSELERLAETCHDLLRPGGRLLITVPSPAVDRLIPWLIRLGLIIPTSLDEHHEFDPATVPRILRHPGLRLAARRRFQLGLNNLFVFVKSPASPGAQAEEAVVAGGTL